MTADRNHIIETALTLTAQAKPTSRLTAPKLAAFLNVEAGDVIAALEAAPAHIQRAWGLEPGPVGEGAGADMPQKSKAADAFRFPPKVMR